MQAMKFEEKVGQDGILHLNVGKPPGTRLEIIVLNLDEPDATESLLHAKMQETSGFAISVLGKREEDVWNDL